MYISIKIIKKKYISAHVKLPSNNDLNEYKNETELSNEIWRIKNSGHHSKVK